MPLLTRLAWLAVVFALVGAPAGAQVGADLRGGTGTLYIGGYAGKIYVIDEATEQVVDEIQVTSGIPGNLTLSADRNHFYMTDVTVEFFEIIDIASRSTIDTLTFSEGATRTRIESYAVDPQERYALFVTQSRTKLIDRFEIGEPEFGQYDLSTRELIRTMPWPDDKARPRMNMLFSPDGSLLYIFGREVVIYETDDFTEVDRWDLSEPLEPGLGPLRFGFTGSLSEEFGFYTSLFTVASPVRGGRQMGVARVDLNAKEIEDFYTLGPAVGVSFSVTLDGSMAYGLVQEIGNYEFWAFDLANRRLGERQRFNGRPRMSLKPSTNGQLLYVHGAGQTIDIYEADTFQYLRTLELEADATMTGLIVMPPD
ncbi:MAG: hypothetical protein QF463_07030 [Vicinamibacterales bacterium]|nr:hypothetical protein [Acidobacteriota bacterium]MDP6372158.1 hypothetical protein [Vicinamibacterales bacterium]MDP6608801.1 hypothetical protein [Vicinamibacterales bacterium]